MNNLIKKGIAAAVILLFVCVSAVPSTGTTVEKKSTVPISSGNIFYVGGSGPNNYTKIQDAIDNTSDGDTVFVYNDSSPYNEYITINKSIYLIGEDKETTIIEYPKDGPIIIITADGVTLSDFKIENPHETTNRGIRVYANNTTIINNIIRKTRHAIVVTNSNNNSIINNNLARGAKTGVGIYLENCYNTLIDNNNIAGFFSCMELSYCYTGQSNKIIGNILDCSDARYGLQIDKCTNFEIMGNNISGCSDSKGAALYMFHGSEHNNIHHNIIKNNYVGLRFEFENGDNNIHYNIIENNTLGLNFGDTTGTIHHNTFISNKQNATFNYPLQNLFFNKWYKNYWDGPRLTPKIIRGGIILRIPSWPELPLSWVKFDWRPALKPYDIPNLEELMENE